MYDRLIKRILDILLSLAALVILWPALLVLAVLGGFLMRGNPFFVQPRPGKNERIFYLIKFRTMTCQCDAQGNLLPDEVRLTRYGKMLRSTSLDELPELLNILKGDMSFVGPRPQLVRDMVFMSPEQRRRHSVMPGLTGLAQISGRNNMSWEMKFAYDLKYIENISFREDLRILLMTVIRVFQQDGITEEGMATAIDFGDYLLRKGEVTQEVYEQKQAEARKLLETH